MAAPAAGDRPVRQVIDVAVTVAVDETDVLGVVAVVGNSTDASGEIDMIAVDPAVQRRGVGRALTAPALEQLRAAGCTHSGHCHVNATLAIQDVVVISRRKEIQLPLVMHLSGAGIPLASSPERSIPPLRPRFGG